MIVFIYGTTAELIKLSPIMHRLDEVDMDYEVWCTGQQIDELIDSASALTVRVADHWIARGFRGHSLSRINQVPIWLAGCFIWTARNYKSTRKRFRNQSVVFIVHGDTMTTVVGALIGRFLRSKVAHVEAGLRSHDWRNPFPEELDRKIAGVLCSIHFAPDKTAEENLAKATGVVINTYGNTSIDALRFRTSKLDKQAKVNRVLVLLHRSEFLRDSNLVQETFQLLLEVSQKFEVVVVADALSSAALQRQGITALLEKTPNVRVLGKQSHQEFIALLLASEMVITDSGGVQEECAAVGIPCFIHRKATERSDGLGENCILTYQDTGTLASLVNDYVIYSRVAPTNQTSPSMVITDYLKSSGY